MFSVYKKHYINNFFLKLNFKRKLLNNLKKYFYILNKLNYKFIPTKILCTEKKLILIMYIINISLSKSNVFIHVKTSFGHEIFFYSIGSLGLNKKKIKKLELLQNFLKLILLKMLFLKNKPFAINLFNLNFNFNWFLEKLYTKSFIISINLYNSISYNGCRKKKLKKKINTI